MAEIKKSNETKDYKERFEFRLTVGDNIICQRYFKINNFNVTSVRSYELLDTIRACADRIHRDLVDKTYVYLCIAAPRQFDSVAEMKAHFAKYEGNVKSYLASVRKNDVASLSRDEREELSGIISGLDKIVVGEGIVVKDSDVDYFWDGIEPKVAQFKFDEGEFNRELTDEDVVSYKFAFYIDGHEVCSTVWDGIYPKYIRNSIDLSNKRGKFEDMDKDSMGFEQYLMYKLVEGRKDLVWGLIKDICNVCSRHNSDGEDYTVSTEWAGKEYDNKLSNRFRNQ